jgi:hypothetical protein
MFNGNPNAQPAFIDLTGRRFGRLTVEAMSGKRVRGKAAVRMWWCVCDCGKRVEVAGFQLRHAHTKSCGCLQRAVIAEARRSHSMSRTPEYGAWARMNRRCRPGGPDDHLYYGKGIRVCDRWRGSFLNFLADMGPRPSPRHSIDRIDGSGDYEPSNCRWALPVVQANNTTRNVKITHEGETLSAAQWADRKGIGRSTVYQRIRRGVDPIKAISTQGA